MGADRAMGGLCNSEADEAKQELAEAAKHPLTPAEQQALFDKAWKHFDQSSTGELNADELKGMMVMLEQARLAAMEDKWKAKEAEMQTVDEKQDWLAMIAEGRQIHQDTIKDAQAGSPAYIERVKEVVDTNADGKVDRKEVEAFIMQELKITNKSSAGGAAAETQHAGAAGEAGAAGGENTQASATEAAGG